MLDFGIANTNQTFLSMWMTVEPNIFVSYVLLVATLHIQYIMIMIA